MLYEGTCLTRIHVLRMTCPTGGHVCTCLTGGYLLGLHVLQEDIFNTWICLAEIHIL